MNTIAKIFLSIVLLSISTNLISQNRDINVEISESDRKGLFDGILGVVGKVDDGFYVLRTKAKSAIVGGLNIGGPIELYIDKYSNKLKLVKSIEITDIGISPTGKSKGSEYEFCMQDENGILHVYFSEFVKGINSLYRIEMDPNMKSFKNEILVHRDKKANKKLDRRGSYSNVESEDKNKFAIYSFVNERNAKYTEVYASVYDKNLETQWEMKQDIDGYNRNGSFSLAFQTSYKTFVGKSLSLSLSNDGVLNIMRKIYDDGFFASFSREYSHLIYSLSGPENKIASRFFEFEETDIIEAMIRHDQENELNIVGYTGDERRRIVGVIFIDLDSQTLETVTKRSVKLTDKQKEDFLVSSDADSKRKSRGDSRTKKRIDKGKKVRISANNGLVNVYVHEDNSTTVVSEYFDIITNTTRDVNGNMSTTTTYIYGDLKYINISEDGEVRWVKNIHKDQRSGSQSLLGVSDLFIDDRITYLYNDFQDYKLVMTTMDSDGGHTTYDIADLGRKGELEKHWFVPRSVNYLSEDEIIGFAMRLVKTKLIKINL